MNVENAKENHYRDVPLNVMNIGLLVSIKLSLPCTLTKNNHFQTYFVNERKNGLFLKPF